MSTPKTRARTPSKRRRFALNIVLQVLAMLGIGLLVYPDAASWFATFQHNSEISGYVESVEQTPSEERQRILDAAYAYNDTLQPGSLTDPYISEDPDEARSTAVYSAYEQLLRVSGSDAIGTLSYPRLGIGLPVYHGTADETISRGVGHMFGTSMPVGGPSTHSVMTAHSGLPNAKLFTSLLEAKAGDTFWVSVLGEDHHYRVESTETVLATDSVDLEIHKDEDWVTLFTCAPIGINSHRYMVHAVRIPNPDSAQADGAIVGDGRTAGFPWWAVWFIGGALITGFVLFAPAKRRRSAGRTTSDTAKPDSPEPTATTS